MTPNPIFSQYEKNKLFGEQCAIEWSLSEQWYHTQQLMMKHPDIADQLLENYKLLSYNELLNSFRQVDMKDDAPWRERFVGENWK